MIMIKIKQLTFRLLFIGLLIFTSCSDDDNIVIPSTVQNEGFFIVNEGAFGKGNTSLSFYDQKTKKVSNEVFLRTNNRPLGDQSQSMTIHNGDGYIIVQNSKKIEVIDIDTYKSTGTVSIGLPSPRYFLGFSETKGYVSDWGEDGLTGTVKVLDLATNTVTKTIPTGRQGSNQMVLLNNKLYVANSGGWGRDSTISVINTSMDEIERTINVSNRPHSIVTDKESNIWIGAGHTAYNDSLDTLESESTPSAIIKIDPTNGDILMNLTYQDFSSITNLHFNVARDTLYYLYSEKIYNVPITATELPSIPFSSTENSFYGLSVNLYDNTIIGLETPDFTSSGKMDFYDKKGIFLNSFVVGIAPNATVFK